MNVVVTFTPLDETRFDNLADLKSRLYISSRHDGLPCTRGSHKRPRNELAFVGNEYSDIKELAADKIGYKAHERVVRRDHIAPTSFGSLAA